MTSPLFIPATGHSAARPIRRRPSAAGPAWVLGLLLAASLPLALPAAHAQPPASTSTIATGSTGHAENAAEAAAAVPGSPVPPPSVQSLLPLSTDGQALPANAQEILHSNRFRQLAHELRCLVCQNQTLLDSHSSLAQDLRHEVVRLIASGRDDAQIKQYLVDRYGEFVLYRPSWSWRNALLWAGPALMLLLALLAARRMAGRRPPGQSSAASEAAPGSTATSRMTSGGDAPAHAPGAASPAADEQPLSAQAALRQVDELLAGSRPAAGPQGSTLRPSGSRAAPPDTRPGCSSGPAANSAADGHHGNSGPGPALR